MREPKFQTIYTDLLRRLTDGELLPGERLPPEKELARQYGVALLTLRQAMRRLKEEGLLISRRYHGTVVAPKGGQGEEYKGRVGMVIPYGMSTLRHPVFSRLVDGVEGVLAERGYHVEFVVSNPDNGISEKALKRAIDSMNVVGWMVPTAISEQAKGWIVAQGTPRVSFHIVDDLFCPHLFLVDRDKLASLLLDHLYDEGYRKVWVIHPRSMYEWAVHLEHVGCEQNSYADLQVRVMESSDCSAEVGAEVCREILSGDAVDAFVCADDDLALGAYQAIEESGVQIPQIGVVGGGDFPMGERIRPTLTTVAYPYYQIGREGAGVLLDQLDGKPVEPAHRQFLPRLVVRQSTLHAGNTGGMQGVQEESMRGKSHL